MRSRKVFIALIVMTVLNFLDLITMLPVVEFESNPIYHSHGIYGLIFIKVFFNLLMWLLYYYNKFHYEWLSFLFVFYIVWISFILLYFGILLNLTTHYNPDIIASSVDSIQTDNKIYYRSVMNFFFIIPAVLNLIVFWLHKDNIKYCMIVKNDKRT